MRFRCSSILTALMCIIISDLTMCETSNMCVYFYQSKCNEFGFAPVSCNNNNYYDVSVSVFKLIACSNMGSLH